MPGLADVIIVSLSLEVVIPQYNRMPGVDGFAPRKLTSASARDDVLVSASNLGPAGNTRLSMLGPVFEEGELIRPRRLL